MSANKPLTAVPTLDQLKLDPSKVSGLPPAVARALLVEIATIQPLLMCQAFGMTETGEPTVVSDDLLTVEQVTQRFGVTQRWLYRHKKHLPHCQPTRKVILFPAKKLERWFAAQKTN
jgi:hypothetical protein